MPSTLRYRRPAYRNYYVDATGGNDTKLGLNPEEAWQTIAKVNAASLQPGDGVLLRRGQVWRETLTVPSSGALGTPITFGAYGSGADPILNGADIITTWTQYAGTTWQHGLTTQPKSVVMDGVWLTLGTNRDTLNDHEWIWVSNVLYLRDDTGDPDTTGVVIEVSQRNTLLTGTAKPYITIENLSFYYANFAALRNEQSDYWTIRNCAFYDSDVNEILVRGSTTGSAQVSGLEISGCTVDTHSININTCLQVRGALNAKIYDNTIVCSGVGGTGSGIGTQSGGINGVGAVNNGIQVYRNQISGPIAGILMQYAQGSLVHRNYVHDGKGYGIAINRYSDNVQVYNNLIYNMTATVGETSFNGIDVNIGCDNGFSYHNTIYKVAGFCHTLENTTDPCNGWTLKNNILDSSANYDVGASVNASYFINAGLTFTIDNNLVNISDAICRGFATITDLATWNAQTGVGTDLEGVPLFINPASDWHLQAGSPCRNTGVNVGIADDYDGASRPMGDGYDIGAFEFVE